jgi:hypothetical protein
VLQPAATPCHPELHQLLLLLVSARPAQHQQHGVAVPCDLYVIHAVVVVLRVLLLGFGLVLVQRDCHLTALRYERQWNHQENTRARWRLTR